MKNPMKYKIDWMEHKTTSTGKKMIKASLNDGTKVITEVAIWEGFPNFAELMPGVEVEGDLVEKQNGQYVNRSLYAPKVAPTGQIGGNKGAYKTKLMTEMVEKKQEGIKKAQDNKEFSIRVASVNNSAVQCAIAEFGKMDKGADMKFLIEKWRKYLWLSWENHEKYDLPFVSNEKELEIQTDEMPPDEAYEGY